MAVGAYNFTNPMTRFREAEAMGDQWRRDRARIDAGRRVARGDFEGGAKLLYNDGALDEGSSVQTYGRKLADDQGSRRAATALANRQYESAAQEYGALGDAQGVAGSQNAQVEQLKRQQEYLKRVAPALKGVYQKAGPEGVAKAFDFAAQDMKRLGATDEEIEPIRQGLMQDPDTTLSLIEQQAQKNYEYRTSGDEVLVFADGQLVDRYRGGKSMSIPKGGKVYDIPGEYGSQGGPEGAQGGGMSPAATTLPPGLSEPLVNAWINQESGNRPGIEGPMTQWGRAQGLTQMLPATAQAMAQKLGLPWRPELMTDKGPEGAAYQRQLGLAYLQEGMEKYGGDMRKALMYYHGGPDEKLWGRKTRGYAEAILRNSGTMRPADQPYQVASAGATPPPPMQGGPRVIAENPETPDWTPMSPAEAAQYGPGQWLKNANGDVKQIGGTAPKDKITDTQRQAASLAYAAFAGNDRLNQLAREGIYKPSSPIESMIQPDANGLIRIVARNPQDRRFIQAATEFIAPVLRKDTGAAVTYQEFMFYKDMLIPAFEDDPALLWQKAQGRDDTLRRLYGASRPAFDAEYGAPGKRPVLTDPRARPKPKSGGKGQPQGRTVIDINGRVIK